MIIYKAYKLRIFPTKAQETILNQILGLCRELYNAALQERRDAWRMSKKTINFYAQSKQLPAIKEDRPEFKVLDAHMLEDVLKRVNLAYEGFFNRLKSGGKFGYPRFLSRNRYNSITYRDNGWSLRNNVFKINRIGTFKIKLHRSVIGKVKTCTLKRDGLNWYVCFSVEYEFAQPTHEGPAVGIDVGLENFANLSNGEQVENPRLFRKSEKHLAKVQRKVSKLRSLPKTNRAKVKAKRSVTRAFRKVRNQRLDFAHKLSAKLSKENSLIAVEDLNIKGLASGMLAKSVNDAGWSLFLQLLAYKVEYTGSKLVKVDPRYTSQTCPNCGNIRKKELAERWHSCACGASMHRDIAAAQVILSRGLATVRNQSVDTPPVMVGE